MADTHCTKCGEPWDVDCLHDADDYGLQLDGTRIVACSACEWHAKRGYPMRGMADAATAMHDILGDDIDGIASMLGDAAAMGLFRD
jgi:hypothetical protein